MMYSGAYLHLIGGKILSWYYKYYTPILRDYFDLNPDEVFKEIQDLTKGTTWDKKKITVKLAITKGKIVKGKMTKSKITKITITKYVK